LLAETFHACTDTKDKPKRLPADLAARLIALMPPPDLVGVQSGRD